MRRTVSTVAAGLLLALAAAHATEPQAHRETLAGINVAKGTAYVPKESAFCASCLTCPTLATDKARAACRKRFCTKCPDNIILGAEQGITANVGGTDILKLSKDEANINGDANVSGDLGVDGDAAVDGDLDVAGTSNLDGDVNVGGDLAVTGDSVFTGSVEFQQPMTTDDLIVNGLFGLDGVGNDVVNTAVALDFAQLGTGNAPNDCPGDGNGNLGKLQFFQLDNGRVVLARCTLANGSTMWKYVGGGFNNPADP